MPAENKLINPNFIGRGWKAEGSRDQTHQDTHTHSLARSCHIQQMALPHAKCRKWMIVTEKLRSIIENKLLITGSSWTHTYTQTKSNTHAHARALMIHKIPSQAENTCALPTAGSSNRPWRSPLDQTGKEDDVSLHQRRPQLCWACLIANHHLKS